MVRIGLVGCGTIGSKLAEEIQRRFTGIARLIGVHDIHSEKAVRLASRLHPSVPVLSAREIVRRSSLIIEAASPKAVAQLLPQVIRQKKSLMVLSSGGLLSQAGRLRAAAKRGIPVYVPSGAIAGLDGIKAAAVEGLRSVTLTTRKPPKALRGAPGAGKLGKLRSPKTIFRGSAARAAKLFPQNINVAATLALAGIGPVRTRVRIIADPGVRANIHEIEARGTFGKLVVRAENRPAPGNPRTSRLAAQSAAALLGQILQPFRVGT